MRGKVKSIPLKYPGEMVKVLDFGTMLFDSTEYDVPSCGFLMLMHQGP
jgi:hypothetical protein